MIFGTPSDHIAVFFLVLPKSSKSSINFDSGEVPGCSGYRGTPWHLCRCSTIHCWGILELPRALWTVFWKSRDIIQTVEKNWVKNKFLSWRKIILKNMFQKLYSQKVHKKIKLFENFENQIFKIFKKFDFLVYVFRIYFLKNIFQISFSPR